MSTTGLSRLVDEARGRKPAAFVCMVAFTLLMAVPAQAGAAQRDAFVTHQGTPDVMAFDVTGSGLSVSLPYTMQRPFAIAATPDGKRVYISNTVSKDLTVIDTETRQIVATVPMCHYSSGVAVTPDSRRVFAACALGGTSKVFVIANDPDPAKIRKLAEIDVDGLTNSSAAVSEDGQRVFFTRRNYSDIAVLNNPNDLSKLKVEAEPVVGKNPWRIAVAPDPDGPQGAGASQIYVSHTGSKKVTVLNDDLVPRQIGIDQVLSLDGMGYGIVSSPDGSQVYVSTFNGSLSAIDTRTKNVSTVSGLGGYDIDITADGEYAYLPTYNQNRVKVVKLNPSDPSANPELVTTIDVPGGTGVLGGYPNLVAVADPDGPDGPEPERAFVANFRSPGSSTGPMDIPGATVIDTTDNSVEETIGLGNDRRGLVVGPDGKRAYIVTANPSELLVVDTSRVVMASNRQSIGAFVATVIGAGGGLGIGEDCQDPAITPDGSYVLVPCRGSGHLTVVDTATNRVVKTVQLPGGTRPYAVGVVPGGERAYISATGASGRGEVWVVDIASDFALWDTPIVVGNDPRGIAVTPDGRYIYVAHFGENSNGKYDISKITDAATFDGIEVATIPVKGPTPHDLAILPDPDGAAGPKSELLYITNYDEGLTLQSGTISVLNTGDDTEVIDPVPVGRKPLGIAMTPMGDRAYVAVSNALSSWMSVIDTETYGVSQQAVDSQPAKIAIAPNQAPKAEISAYSTTVKSGSQSLVLNGADSNDLDGGQISKYKWDFGDGEQQEGAVVSHTYDEYAPSPVDYEVTVTLSVTDDENGHGQDEYTGRMHLQRGSGQAQKSIQVTVLDGVVPDTEITGGPGGLTRDTSAGFEFEVRDEPDAALSSYECALDPQNPSVDSEYEPCGNGASGTVEYADLRDGPHTLLVRAIDDVGNVDPEPATYTWTVDTAAPTTTINSGPPAETADTTATFGFSASEPGSTFECSLDQGAYAPCTSPAQYTNLGLGSHTVRIRATDSAGNVGVPAVYSWTVTSPPVTGQPSSPSNQGNSANQGGGPATDKTPPKVKIKRLSRRVLKRRSRRRVKFTGTATDDSRIVKVEGAIARVVRRTKRRGGKVRRVKRCQFTDRRGKLKRRARSCRKIRYFRAKGTTRWRIKLRRHLPRGRYVLYVRAKDEHGNVSRPKRLKFKVR